MAEPIRESNGFDLRFEHPRWPDLKALGEQGLVFVLMNSIIDVGTQQDGTVAGDTVVAFRFPLPEGRTLLYQTTHRALADLLDAITAHHGDPPPTKIITI